MISYYLNSSQPFTMMHRRNFIKGTAATLALSAFQFSSLADFNPQKTYRVALIGTGWYGKSDLFRLMQVAKVDLAGLCDPDSKQLNEANDIIRKRHPNAKPRLYKDYREMLRKEKPELVLIGTPDHWHALTAIEAIEQGAHVYLQKPISVDVLEGEAILKAARKHNRKVQIGTQRRSTPHLIEAKKKYIDSGALGKITHVEMCCYYHMRNNSNPPLQEIPAHFDYNLWTGPAPLRPYDGLPHIGWWRAFMEYGNGIMGDMCVHMLDAARWMLDLGWPSKISSTGGILNSTGKSNIADTQVAVFEFDQLNCVWQHRTWGTTPDNDYPWGLFIYGEKGTLKASPYQYDFIPVKGDPVRVSAVYEKEKYPEDVTEKSIEIHAAPATRLHMINLIESIEQNKKPVADIEEGHISTASCILANISMQLQRPVKYDPVKKEVVNDAEATALLKRNYRDGYKHPWDRLG